MGGVEWIRLSTSMFDNRKIKQLEVAPKGKQIVLIWVRLICLAGSVNGGGMVYVTEGVPYTVDGLAVELNENKALVKKALELFEKFNMIGYADDGSIIINGWEKHQNAEGLNKIREQTKERVKRYRANKAEPCNADVTLQNEPCNADVTLQTKPCNVTRNVTSVTSNTDVTQQNKNKNKNKNRENYISLLNPLSCPQGGQNVTELYEEKISPLTQTIAEQLRDLLDEYGEERVRRGIEIAAENKAVSIAYVAKCVANPIADKKKQDLTATAEAVAVKMQEAKDDAEWLGF